MLALSFGRIRSKLSALFEVEWWKSMGIGYPSATGASVDKWCGTVEVVIFSPGSRNQLGFWDATFYLLHHAFIYSKEPDISDLVNESFAASTR